MQNKKIILASDSPRRRQLLANAGFKFKAVSSGYHEDISLKMKPKELVKFLALGKALKVVKKYPKAIVIASDTIVALDQKVLGKPASTVQAKIFLRKLSGRSNSVITSLVIIDAETGKKFVKAYEAKVYFRKMSETEINYYIKTGEPMDKAGAYAIQGYGSAFIDKVVGDYFTVVGLPIFSLVKELKKFGIKIV